MKQDNEKSKMQTSSRIKESHMKGMPIGIIACAWGNNDKALKGRHSAKALIEELMLEDCTCPTHNLLEWVRVEWSSRLVNFQDLAGI